MKMKPAITITTTILVSVLAVGTAMAQSPSMIQHARSTMNGVSNRATAASNEALGVHDGPPSAATARAAAKSSAAPAKTSSSPAPANSASMKRRERRGRGANLVVQSAPTAPAEAEKEAAQVARAADNGVSGNNEESEQSVLPDSKYNANGRRDPFISPVVSHAGGSGCSTGKKCLEIGNVNLRGVVRSEGGFIAVVSNGLNKAYFLRENDPVFCGYVMKITGDSIVFQETLQDRLGKTFTREVTKKITTPAV